MRSPFCFRMHESWEVTTPRSGAQLGHLLNGRQGPGTSLSWACLNAWLVSQTLGQTCEMLLLQMKSDHRHRTEACLGHGFPALFWLTQCHV